MEELKPCPFCGGNKIQITGLNEEYYSFCQSCGGEGPPSESENGAIAFHNRRAETPIEAAAKALYRAIKTKWIKVIRAKGETFISACQIWNNFEATIRVDKEKQNEKNCKMDSCGS
jgi:Lar family restriction alleviation protein